MSPRSALLALALLCGCERPNVEGGRQRVLLHQVFELAELLMVKPSALFPRDR